MPTGTERHYFPHTRILYRRTCGEVTQGEMTCHNGKSCKWDFSCHALSTAKPARVPPPLQDTTGDNRPRVGCGRHDGAEHPPGEMLRHGPQHQAGADAQPPPSGPPVYPGRV